MAIYLGVFELVEEGLFSIQFLHFYFINSINFITFPPLVKKVHKDYGIIFQLQFLLYATNFGLEVFCYLPIAL